ncbi:beta-N-acetylhexosaminidase [Bdellovibrionota bacterium FG-1]
MAAQPRKSPDKPSPGNPTQTARTALGQLFIMGFSGPELSAETQAFISQAGIGGLLLQTVNYESPAQLAELSNQAQECSKEFPLWIAVDHEGGRVQRFKKHFTRIPDAAVIGAMNSPRLAFEISEMVAKELKAVGINLNFAPVVDIATDPRNAVLVNRAYGNTEDTVSKIANAVVRGHVVQGVQPCIKHFPGHGDTGTDSHFSLPRVDTTLEILREREFKPFTKAFKSRCAMVMTGHIVCTRLDPEFPATLSAKILRGILRTELRYSRLIISDEMEMKAISDHYSAEHAPILALQAGCDVLLYKAEAGARLAYAAVLKALDEGQLAPAIILEAARRVRDFKQSTLLPYHPAKVADVGKTVGIPEHQQLMEQVLAGPASGEH